MQKNLEELTAEFSAIVGDNDSDDVLAFLEDLADSMNANPPEREDLTAKVAELEGKLKELKKRYRDRFYGRSEEEEESVEEEETSDGEKIKIKDLFKEE